METHKQIENFYFWDFVKIDTFCRFWFKNGKTINCLKLLNKLIIIF